MIWGLEFDLIDSRANVVLNLISVASTGEGLYTRRLLSIGTVAKVITMIWRNVMSGLERDLTQALKMGTVREQGSCITILGIMTVLGACKVRARVLLASESNIPVVQVPGSVTSGNGLIRDREPYIKIGPCLVVRLFGFSRR